MAKQEFGTERRDEAAKWTHSEIGTQDFSTDGLKPRRVGSFEKGQPPEEPQSATEDAMDKGV